VRAAYRVVRMIIGLVLLALSVGWLLRRRRAAGGELGRPRLSVVPPPAAAGPTERRPAEQAEPRSAGPAGARTTAPAEPLPAEPVEPRSAEPVEAIGRPVHDAAVPNPAVPNPAKTAPAGTVAAGGPAQTAAEPATAAAPAEAAPAETAAAEAAPPVTAGLEAPAAAEPVAAVGAMNGAVVGAVPDDLRQIRGIGPAIESALHDLGIHTYQQLASLDEAGRDRVQAALRDPWHRLDRDDWVGQARELHRSKYGAEPPAP
jgi:predicted flap endonuclease-1-like 5' DNA nuclease